MRHKTIGPRGGITVEEVSCFTCLCWPRCTLVSSTKEFGCGDWTSDDGRRVFWGPEDKGKDPLPDRPITDCSGCDKCADLVEPPPVKLPENMEEAAPIQRDLNHARSVRMDHIREEIEAERVAPPDEENPREG